MTGHVYVAKGDGYGCKIGRSIQPVVRVGAVAKDVDFPVTLAFASAPLEDASAVELLAHWLIRDRHIKGEWFDVETHQAVAAVNEASRRVEAGESAPRRINTRKRYGDTPKDIRIQLVVSSDEIALLDAWRGKNQVWSRSEAIRRLITEALTRDMAA